MDKKILDVTCGSKTIWFDKHHPAAVYCDRRREEYRHIWKNDGNCSVKIDPDILCDFTDLPFTDNSFPLVVFDPPHLTSAKETAWLVKKYGKLDKSWPKMLHDGFTECMRVLKPDGVLIFKWSEHDIPAEKVWRAIGQKPLFGHHSGKKSGTFWGCFMKFAETEPEMEEATKPNDPLTVDELWKMDGEPVWCIIIDGDYKGESFWGLVSIDTAECICSDWDVIIFAYYGKTWLAYRRKPKEADQC